MSRMDNSYFMFGCPAIMNDGRIYTSYLNRHDLNDAILAANGINKLDCDNNCQRSFFQRNAVSLIQGDRQYLMRNYTCSVPKKVMIIDPPYAICK